MNAGPDMSVLERLLEWFINGKMSFKVETPPIEGAPIVVIPLLVMLPVSILWCLWDAERRGKSTWLTFFFILMGGWPLSVLWWLWLRPKLPVVVVPDVAQGPTGPPMPPPMPGARGA